VGILRLLWTFGETPTMTSQDHVTPPTVWVAIDIAKHWNVALVEHPDGRQQRFRFPHHLEDYDRLVGFLKGSGFPCRIAFESTSDYHRTLGYRLLCEGFEVCLVSSVAGARYREVMFNSWDKNDPKDAEVILRLLKQGMTQRYYDPLINGIHDLQEIAKTYYQISRTRTRLQHLIVTHFLPLYFPEIERYWYHTRNQWFARFLHKFPTPYVIQAMSEEQFIEEPWDVTGRKVEKRRQLAQMYKLAQSSVALPVAEDFLAIEGFRLQLTRFLTLNEQRAALEERAHALLKDRADYQQLRTLPGIGPIIALTVLAEAGDLRRFSHHRQFLKFCGLDLAKAQSGVSRGLEKLCKRGNPRLRCALWQASMSAVRMRENAFRDKYTRYIAADPDNSDLKRKARTAVTAKMARVAFALVKFNKPYRCRYEEGLPSGSIPLNSCP
jgi:transposase